MTILLNIVCINKLNWNNTQRVRNTVCNIIKYLQAPGVKTLGFCVCINWPYNDISLLKDAQE